jgi:hypothetical protein
MSGTQTLATLNQFDGLFLQPQKKFSAAFGRKENNEIIPGIGFTTTGI